MFSELDRYKQTGHFFFKKGDILSEVCNAPEESGVYIIHQLARGRIQMAFIAAAGTISTNGNFIAPLLKEAINGEQANKQRQKFFDDTIKKKAIDAFDIYWYVTFNKRHQDLPSFVKAILLQTYFEVYGCLPEWNNFF